MKPWEIAETGVNVAGVMVSVVDLNNILNLIVLVISIGCILIRGGIKIYQLIKDKKLKEAAEEIERIQKEIEERAKKDGR